MKLRGNSRPALYEIPQSKESPIKESQWRVRREVMTPALAIGAPLMIVLVRLILINQV